MCTESQLGHPLQTPLYRFRWEGRTDIFVKDESKCPTGTFKDRLAWCLAKNLKAIGADNRYLISSITLGNTLVSLTAAFEDVFGNESKPQLLGIFPRGFSERTIGPNNAGFTMQGGDVLAWLDQHGSHWVEYPLDEGYIAAHSIREIAVNAGLVFDKHQDISNGIGVPAYETILQEALAECNSIIDVAIVPVGAGVLFDEFVDFIELKGITTRVLGVTTINMNSIADKIYGIYSPYFTGLMRDGIAFHPTHPRHRVVTVADEDIRRAMMGIPASINAEPSAAAAFVPLDMPGEIDQSSSVIVISTGDGIRAQRLSN